MISATSVPQCQQQKPASRLGTDFPSSHRAEAQAQAQAQAQAEAEAEAEAQAQAS